MFRSTGLLPLVLLVACGGADRSRPAVRTTDHSFAADHVPAGQLPDGVRPLHYALDLTINPAEERFSGHARIRIELDGPVPALWLHGRSLDVTEVKVTPEGGEPMAAQY